jgi:hypothetical protein
MIKREPPKGKRKKQKKRQKKKGRVPSTFAFYPFYFGFPAACLPLRTRTGFLRYAQSKALMPCVFQKNRRTKRNLFPKLMEIRCGTGKSETKQGFNPYSVSPVEA